MKQIPSARAQTQELLLLRLDGLRAVAALAEGAPPGAGRGGAKGERHRLVRLLVWLVRLVVLVRLGRGRGRAATVSKWWATFLVLGAPPLHAVRADRTARAGTGRWALVAVVMGPAAG